MDVISLLYDLKEQQGVAIKDQLAQLKGTNEIPISVLKFINDNKPLDVTEFYKKVRNSYNNKHSKLYINIVKQNPENTISTLTALLNQIVLFSEKVDDKAMFFKHVRAQEITEVLNKYFDSYDLTDCCKLLYLVKADLKAVEMLYRDNI